MKSRNNYFDTILLSDEEPTYSLTLADWIRLFDGDELRAHEHFAALTDIKEAGDVASVVSWTTLPTRVVRTPARLRDTSPSFKRASCPPRAHAP